MAEAQRRRIVFMGTPDFAAIILRALIQWDGADIVGVYSQPDRKSGRGMAVKFPAVKQVAIERNLPVFQPAILRDAAAQAELEKLCPDFIVVASYGLILPQAVLDMAAIAPVNVHASLLPLYRGAAPVQRAIMENFGPDAATGVSIMKMTSGLDAGPVYSQEKLSINCQSCADVQQRLARAGASLLIETLEKLSAGQIEPWEQDASKATYARKLVKTDGLIDWTRPAAEVDARIRAVTPWPGALATLELAGGKRVSATLFPGKIGEFAQNARPGQIWRHKNGLSIACGDCWYVLGNLKMPGRKEIPACDFANGQCKIKNGICGQALAPDES